MIRIAEGMIKFIRSKYYRVGSAYRVVIACVLVIDMVYSCISNTQIHLGDERLKIIGALVLIGYIFAFWVFALGLPIDFIYIMSKRMPSIDGCQRVSYMQIFILFVLIQIVIFFLVDEMDEWKESVALIAVSMVVAWLVVITGCDWYTICFSRESNVEDAVVIEKGFDYKTPELILVNEDGKRFEYITTGKIWNKYSVDDHVQLIHMSNKLDIDAYIIDDPRFIQNIEY